jgi:proteic killer suppression protein
MIRSCSDKATRRTLDRLTISKLGAGVQRIALRKLRQIDAAVTLDDLRVPPGTRLEILSGARAGQYSVRIAGRWRICFRWVGGDARDVELVRDR